MSHENADAATVEGFGQEWSTFDYAEDTEELRRAFGNYFAVFPWHELPSSPVGIDVGCGTGRWARYVAPRVGRLICIDASADALAVARRNLRDRPNVDWVQGTIEQSSIADDSLDFAYSLGVLHHIPDTEGALRAAVRKLKPGAPMLVYLYYALDNRPLAFRALWRASDVVRRSISRLPFPLRLGASEVIARTVYWPLARGAAAAEKLGVNVSGVPLSHYRDKSLYIMRTDALDRFGTRLEKRYSRAEVEALLRDAGLERIEFHEGEPYWCAVGRRAR
ncbi:class I SAM-dependent methyltransferase [Sandaracinus amylolyticus]|uniref:class I SAM-dependent methyltransferase n=1 Tax=Sandaracinus amylolyticus TaxID=927083 RepID=UPI001F46C77E|nr:class I SAM-dependent methyltransferase [Sandaracinus amylolyticus]UJR80397.1 Class I SAM-dependent methyltransferase [Sandaracinus amylolyticus]